MDVGVVCFGFIVGVVNGFEIGVLVFRFVEVVGNVGCVEDGEGGGVEWVLWDWD